MRKRDLILSSCVWCAVSVPSISLAASFDCSQASTSVERLICASADLSRLDDVLAEAYKDARGRSSNAARRGREQRQWLVRRDACGEDVACIRTAYEARLKALRTEDRRSAMNAVALPFGLQSTYIRDARICGALFSNPAASEGCRANDVVCPGKADNIGTSTGPLNTNGFLAYNAYGYTEVSYLAKEDRDEETEQFDDPNSLTADTDEVADALPKGVAVLFLGRFEGGRHPRLAEMWAVDVAGLRELVATPLPPNDPKAMFIDRERNADLLKALLKTGERLAAEWPPMFLHGGRVYFVERECSGTWVYGGDYVCNRVIKLTFKRLEANRKATAFYQLSTPPRNSNEKK